MRKAEIIQRLLFEIEKLKSPKGYVCAGWPNYNTLFGRDTLIFSLQVLSRNPSIVASNLRILAKYQATETNGKQDSEQGKILHEYRFSKEKQQELPEWEWPYYGSVDATPLFIIVLDEYVAFTDDKNLLKDLWPNVELAVEWLLENSRKNPYSFITYQRANPRGLYHQGWKDSPEDHLKISPPPIAIIEAQGYAYKALRAYFRLASRVGMPIQQASSAAMLVHTIKTNICKFWMEDEQYFALAIDGSGLQRKAITSNPGHLLLCDDFLEKKQAKAIAQRLFQEDLWTIGGIRTLSENDPDFDPFGYHLGSIWPHDNWMTYAGMKRWGFHNEAKKIKGALLRAYKKLGCIPECYAVVRNSFGRQKIIPIKKVEQLEHNVQNLGNHLPSFSANPVQAWALGALLNMLLEN